MMGGMPGVWGFRGKGAAGEARETRQKFEVRRLIIVLIIK